MRISKISKRGFSSDPHPLHCIAGGLAYLRKKFFIVTGGRQKLNCTMVHRWRESYEKNVIS